MVSRVVLQTAYRVVPAVAGTVHRTRLSLAIATTGSVSLRLGERIAMVRPVSTVSRNEIWTLPALSTTRIPVSGSLNPPGPGWTGPTLAATVFTGGVPALAAQPACIGPVKNQAPAKTRNIATAVAAATRMGSVAGLPSRMRSTIAKRTAATHEATTAISQGAVAS